MDEEHLAILKALANRPEGRTLRNLAAACGMQMNHLRDFLAELEANHDVEISGPGVSAEVTIPRAGKLALKAALQGSAPVMVMGGNVQIGDNNRQTFDGEYDDDDDEE